MFGNFRKVHFSIRAQHKKIVGLRAALNFFIQYYNSALNDQTSYGPRTLTWDNYNSVKMVTNVDDPIVCSMMCTDLYKINKT